MLTGDLSFYRYFSDEEDEVFNVNTLDDLPNYEDHAIDFTSEEANFLTDIRKPEIIHVSDMGAINEMLDYDVNTESNVISFYFCVKIIAYRIFS